MRLPQPLQEAIDSEATALNASEVASAAREISARYQRGEFGTPPLRTAAHRLEYLQARMPATYTANVHVLEKVRRRWPQV